MVRQYCNYSVFQCVGNGEVPLACVRLSAYECHDNTCRKEDKEYNGVLN